MSDFETVPPGTLELLEKVTAERDSLMAHVEMCRETFEHLAEYWNGGEGSAAEDAAQHAMDVACDMLEESPATSLARLKAECWKEAYLAGMEHGHHFTVEGGYIPDDEEAAGDYVTDRQAEE